MQIRWVLWFLLFQLFKRNVYFAPIGSRRVLRKGISFFTHLFPSADRNKIEVFLICIRVITLCIVKMFILLKVSYGKVELKPGKPIEVVLHSEPRR